MRLPIERLLHSGFFWITASIICRTGASVCAKYAGLASSSQAVYTIPFSGWYLLQLSFLAVQAVTWIAALRRTALSTAYPMMSIAIILTAIFGVLCFDEVIEQEQLIGFVFIVAGIILVGRSNSKGGAPCTN